MQTPLGVGEAVLDEDVELRVDEVVDVGFAVELLTGGLPWPVALARLAHTLVAKVGPTAAFSFHVTAVAPFARALSPAAAGAIGAPDRVALTDLFIACARRAIRTGALVRKESKTGALCQHTSCSRMSTSRHCSTG